MSCQTCHINPSGGGIRAAPGRYYAISTLPHFYSQNRPYHDSQKSIRKLIDYLWQDKRKVKKSGQSPELSKEVFPTEEEPIKKDIEAKGFYPLDFLSYYAPWNATSLKKQNPYAFRRDRYEALNADPLLTIGADVRPTVVGGPEPASFFPMQFDVGAAFHPVEHMTLVGTLGLQGRSEGYGSTFRRDFSELFKVQNAFLMLHQFPYQSYILGGIFLPEFGLRFEDHTNYGRREFELDPTGLSGENLTYGVQAGLAPNYFYGSLAYHALRNLNLDVNGHAYTINFGWRDIPWGAGASFMHKIRKFEDTGKLIASNINGYYNLWHFLSLFGYDEFRYLMSITFQVEYSLGLKPRTRVQDTLFSAYLFKINYLVFNGLDLHFYHQYFDADLEIEGGSETRLGLGFDYTLIRYIRFSFDLRFVLRGDRTVTEFIVFLHGYL